MRYLIVFLIFIYSSMVHASSGMWPVPAKYYTTPEPGTTTYYWDCVSSASSPITLTFYGNTTFITSGGFDNGGYFSLHTGSNGYHSGAGFVFSGQSALNNLSGTIDFYVRPYNASNVLNIYNTATKLLSVDVGGTITSYVKLYQNGAEFANISIPNGDSWRHIILSWDMSGGAGNGIISGSINGTPFSYAGRPLFTNEFNEFWLGNRGNSGTVYGGIDEVKLYGVKQ